MRCKVPSSVNFSLVASEMFLEMFLFDPYKKYIQSNNEMILDQGTPIKTSLVANIRAAYYIINKFFFISQAIKIIKLFMIMQECHYIIIYNYIHGINNM